MGIAGLGVNAAVGARLVADTVLLFEVELLVGKGMVDVGKLVDSIELVDGIELIDVVELVGGIELLDGVELVDNTELVDEAELVAVVVTINNFSWPAVTI